MSCLEWQKYWWKLEKAPNFVTRPASNVDRRTPFGSEKKMPNAHISEMRSKSRCIVCLHCGLCKLLSTVQKKDCLIINWRSWIILYLFFACYYKCQTILKLANIQTLTEPFQYCKPSIIATTFLQISLAKSVTIHSNNLFSHGIQQNGCANTVFHAFTLCKHFKMCPN
jgi:hypothetical protein